jgi:hypothetical protein
MPQMVTVSNSGFGMFLSMPKYDDKCEDLSCILTTAPDEIFCPVFKATRTKGSAWRSPSVPFKTTNGYKGMTIRLTEIRMSHVGMITNVEKLHPYKY